MLAGGASYRWATPEHGAVVSRDEFALFVPPGRVTKPRGAYISVRPRPLSETELAGIDAHIHGAWREGRSTVAVRLPWSADDPSAQPVLLHESTDGLKLTTGSGLAVSEQDGRSVVTGLQTSLSETEAGAAICGPNEDIICFQDYIDEFNAKTWNDLASELGENVRSRLGQREPCGRVGDAVAFGSMPWGVSCSTDVVNNHAKWRSSNDTDASFLGYNAGVVYGYGLTGGPHDAAITGGDGGNLLESSLVRNLRGQGWFFPGMSVAVEKARDTGTTYLDVRPDLARTAFWSGVQPIITTAVDALGGDVTGAMVSAVMNCAVVEQGNYDEEQVLACVRDVLLLELEQFGLTQSAETLLGSTVRTASSLLKWIDVGTFAISLGFTAGSLAGGGDGVDLTFNSPPPPTGIGGIGGTDPDVGPDGRIVVDGPLHGHSYRLASGLDGDERGRTLYTLPYPNGVAYGALDTNEQLVRCLARRYPLIDFLDRDRFAFDVTGLQVSQFEPPCDEATPEIELPGNATNWILRQENGAAWFVNGDSQLENIDSGWGYIGCAKSYYVLDYAPTEMIDQFGDRATAPTETCSAG